MIYVKYIFEYIIYISNETIIKILKHVYIDVLDKDLHSNDLVSDTCKFLDQRPLIDWVIVVTHIPI